MYHSVLLVLCVFVTSCPCWVLTGEQLNIVSFLAKRLLYTTKIAQADNAGIPFKKVVEEAKFLTLPRAKVMRSLLYAWSDFEFMLIGCVWLLFSADWASTRCGC